VLYLDVINKEMSKDNYSVFINNCEFINNTGKIIKSNYLYENHDDNDNHNNYLKVKISNSYFDKNNQLFYSNCGHYDFENCVFKSMEIDSIDNALGLFFFGASSILNITNSNFSDINSISNFPIISNILGSLTIISNSTFKNCYTEYGFLISKGDYLYIEDTIFEDTSNIFEGINTTYEISNCTFRNMKNKNSLPQIIDSYYSNITISNSEFYNMTLTKSLFNPENAITLNNVHISDINLNSNAILHSLYSKLTIKNLDFINIKCTGDSGESSLILFNSGDMSHKLDISNLNVQKCSTNGPLISITGNSNEISIRDSTFENNNSYGSGIKNDSTKSSVSISNLIYSNNYNNNNHECGNLNFQNEISLSISNSNFTANTSEGNGGTICFENILNLEFNLNSNNFSKNKARNGGALYIGKEQRKDTSNENKEMIIENNNFYENYAEILGGAIYSEYNKISLAKVKSNTVLYNKAGVIGAGIYTSDPYDNKTIDINGFKFEKNTVNSLIDNYTTKPAYISLNTTLKDNSRNINAGNYYPLIFSLHDEYGQIIVDITKHYSIMSLKLKIKLKSDDSIIDNSYLLGNTCTFIKGYCNLNQLQIYGNPEKYILEPHIENYNDELQFKFDPIEITIKECSDNQIVMVNNRGIQYCEEPICGKDCPVGISAKCVAYYKKEKNDINLNKCECLPGWNGNKCENKVYIDYRSTENRIILLIIPIILIMCAYMVFIIINKNKRIIKDVGLYKIILFTTGIVLIYISNTFNSYSSHEGCYLKFVLRHIGIITLLAIFYLCISLGYELGILKSTNKNVEEKLKIVKLLSQNSLSSTKSSSSIKHLLDSQYLIEKSSSYNINSNSSNKGDTSSNYYKSSINNDKNDKNNDNIGSIISQKENISKEENSYNVNNNNKFNDYNSNNEIFVSCISSYYTETTSKNEKCNNNNNINSLNCNSDNKVDDSNNATNITSIISKQNSNAELLLNKNNIEKQNEKNKQSNKLLSLFAYLFNITDIKLNSGLSFSKKNNELNQEIEQPNNIIKRNIKNAHSLFIEVIILYPFFIIITITIPIIMNFLENEVNEIQSNNGEWYFKCKLDTTNLIYSLLEEITIIVILIKGKLIFKYNYIFKNTRYIIRISTR